MTEPMEVIIVPFLFAVGATLLLGYIFLSIRRRPGVFWGTLFGLWIVLFTIAWMVVSLT